LISWAEIGAVSIVEM
jgi:WD40 repeat protein